MAPFLALITPLSDARPDNSLPGQPPYPSQGPGFPTNPIAPGGQPPYPSQGPGFPTNPIAPGGQPPYPSQGPGFPGQLPMPGGQPVYPDNSLPGFPEEGQPGHPSHPIVIPGRPDNSLPEGQPGADNTLPGNMGGEVGWVVAYVPGLGYKWAMIPAEPPSEAQPKG